MLLSGTYPFHILTSHLWCASYNYILMQTNIWCYHLSPSTWFMRGLYTLCPSGTYPQKAAPLLNEHSAVVQCSGNYTYKCIALALHFITLVIPLQINFQHCIQNTHLSVDKRIPVGTITYINQKILQSEALVSSHYCLQNNYKLP
jgi:hypothetical protein